MASRDDVGENRTPPLDVRATGRDVLLLTLVIVPFIPCVLGVVRLDWGFNELSVLLLVAGFAVGLASGRDLTATATDFIKGMEAMLAASLFVDVARAISVVLTDGHEIDTIVSRSSRRTIQVAVVWVQMEVGEAAIGDDGRHDLGPLLAEDSRRPQQARSRRPMQS